MKNEPTQRLPVEDHRALVLWAVECAARVLPYFEAKHPADDRPRQALEAGQAWARGEIRYRQARAAALAAHAAARSASDPASIAAARAAGHAVATAHVPSHARAAASYAVKAMGAAAAATERERQFLSLPEGLRPVLFPLIS
jgi:hypothetical protein